MVLRILAFVAIWTLYFTITEYASAIHNDMAEAFAWGQEFQLGYNQHPPFWAWVCGLWFEVFSRANWAFALLSMLNAGAGLLGAWALIGRFVDGEKRVAATTLLAVTPFYSFLAYKYNANSIFLSIWPWTLYAFVECLRTRKLGVSIGFGAMVGLALNSKYYALTLCASCLLAALASKDRSRYFRSPSPYISISVALVLLAPHLFWLATTGAPPLRYLARVSGRGFAETALFAATAVLGSALQQIVVLGLVGATYKKPRLANDEDAEQHRLLWVLTTAPVVFSFLAAVVLRTKISSNMLIGVFPLSPLLAIQCIRPDVARLNLWALRAATTISVGALAASPIVAVAKGWYGPDSEDREPRREALSESVAFWRRTTDKPLGFIGGSFRYDNAAVFYGPERSHVFVNFDYFGNRWADPVAVRKKGLLTICREDDAPCLANTDRYSNSATRREKVTLTHHVFGRNRDSVEFVITAVPPAG